MAFTLAVYTASIPALDQEAADAIAALFVAELTPREGTADGDEDDDTGDGSAGAKVPA